MVVLEGKRVSTEKLETLWLEYQVTGDARIKDRLVLSLAPLVKYIVYRKIREVPAHLEADDFISAGLVALMGAIERWQPAKGATLEQYAWTRIHGAVLDQLRANDWAPRSLRRWQRDMQKVCDNFTRTYDRAPTHEELADALGITVVGLTERFVALARTEIESLNVNVATEGDAVIERIDTIETADADTDPDARLIREQGLERFREALAGLSEREQLIVTLLYREDCTLREVGQVLGLTESRVCQIHGAIKRRLHEELAADVELFA
jgi:RNA polymerase sigma factor FliA